jgi:hypothetical protein
MFALRFCLPLAGSLGDLLTHFASKDLGDLVPTGGSRSTPSLKWTASPSTPSGAAAPTDLERSG